MKKILLLEDDLFTSRIIKNRFESEGYIVIQSFDLSSSYYAAVENEFDLAIFDVSLPSGSSLDSFDKLKSVLHCPIVVYTAKENKTIELTSLTIGADDFLLKERGLDVLSFRVERLLKNKTSKKNKKENNGNVLVDKNERLLKYKGIEVKLTKKEAAILFYIICQEGYFADRDELSYVTQGQGYDGWSRSLDLSMSRLRKKIEEKSNNGLTLEAIRGKGYKLIFNSE